MSAPHSLQETALTLLCRPGMLGRDGLMALSTADWAMILDWASEHRFAPYLWHSLGVAGLRASLPVDVAARLEGAYRAATFRALSVQREMLGVHDALESAGIPHIFLKGAYLAQFAYPELGLRPMRDIDVLVGRERAMEAFDCLRAAGFACDASTSASAEAFLEDRKHLPRLLSPNGVAIEVHMRLMEGELAHAPASDEFAMHAQGSVRRSLAGRELSFSGAENLLVHLCVHAAIEHRFDNGPLTLCDVRHLVASSNIDWDKVWRIASDLGATRGVALVLKLTQLQWPDLDVGLRAQAAPTIADDADILPIASRLMMRSFSDRHVVEFARRARSQQGVSGYMHFVWRQLFPPRAEMATQFPVRPGSLLLTLYYPVRWFRIVRQRAPQTWRYVTGRRGALEAQELRTIEVWLSRK